MGRNGRFIAALLVAFGLLSAASSAAADPRCGVRLSVIKSDNTRSEERTAYEGLATPVQWTMESGERVGWVAFCDHKVVRRARVDGGCWASPPSGVLEADGAVHSICRCESCDQCVRVQFVPAEEPAPPTPEEALRAKEAQARRARAEAERAKEKAEAALRGALTGQKEMARDAAAAAKARAREAEAKAKAAEEEAARLAAELDPPAPAPKPTAEETLRAAAARAAEEKKEAAARAKAAAAAERRAKDRLAELKEEEADEKAGEAEAAAQEAVRLKAEADALAGRDITGQSTTFLTLVGLGFAGTNEGLGTSARVLWSPIEPRPWGLGLGASGGWYRTEKAVVERKDVWSSVAHYAAELTVQGIYQRGNLLIFLGVGVGGGSAREEASDGRNPQPDETFMVLSGNADAWWRVGNHLALGGGLKGAWLPGTGKIIGDSVAQQDMAIVAAQLGITLSW